MKLRKTVWEYWIWSDVKVMVRGARISVGGWTEKVGTSWPGWASWGWIIRGAWPSLKMGMGRMCWTVSIQKVAVIRMVLALGSGGLG